MTHDLFKDKKELSKYINNEIYKILKEYAYKRNGNDFYLEKKELSCIINIQKGRFLEINEEDFTLNWGLYFPISSYFYNYPLPKKPSSRRELISNRIPFLKDQKDVWWKLYTYSTREEIQEVLREVEYYIREYGVPFLAKFDIIKDAIEILESFKKYDNFLGFYSRLLDPEVCQSILYSFINQKEKSYEIMDKVISETKSELYRENMIGLKEMIKNFDPTPYMDK